MSETLTAGHICKVCHCSKPNCEDLLNPGLTCTLPGLHFRVGRSLGTQYGFQCRGPSTGKLPVLLPLCTPAPSAKNYILGPNPHSAQIPISTDHIHKNTNFASGSELKIAETLLKGRSYISAVTAFFREEKGLKEGLDFQGFQGTEFPFRCGACKCTNS